MGNLDKELLDLIADLVGWTSAKDCFTKGDIAACIETLLTAIPWGKLFKAAKLIPKIWKLFNRWRKLSEKLSKARRARKKADDALEHAAETCQLPPGNSFTPGTPVLLADGTTRPIGSIRAGDRVLATDPVTGLTQPRAVTDLIVGYGVKRLVDVAVRPSPAGCTTTRRSTASPRPASTAPVKCTVTCRIAFRTTGPGKRWRSSKTISWTASTSGSANRPGSARTGRTASASARRNSCSGRSAKRLSGS
ncbi:MAG: hypothetical protein GEV11_07985 [Streptosporangiales bacterium]|nr:hypothetical protein [Streptosporangiales bacterium]